MEQFTIKYDKWLERLRGTVSEEDFSIYLDTEMKNIGALLVKYPENTEIIARMQDYMNVLHRFKERN